MKEFFDCYVDDESDTIDNNDIEKIMQILGEDPTPEQIAKMVSEIDFDADGVVDFDEFTCLMVKQMKHVDDTLEEELETVFKRFDSDNDGFIGPDDLATMMQQLGNEVSLDDAETIIQACFGVIGEGNINF